MVAFLSTHLRPVLAVAVLIGAGVFLAACDSDPIEDGESTEVTVMTYNLYLGADIFALPEAPADQIPAVAAQLWADVQATDFPTRARAIAEIIAEHDPHLIGLQEVTLYRTQAPSDFFENPEPNATEVAYDFLEILLDELSEAGLNYSVAANVENADVEVPATYDGQTFFDIRLTDRDVILARADVSTSDAQNANFSPGVTAVIPVGDLDIPFTRGFNSVRANVDGVSFTFANAHLEVQLPAPQQPQEGQALELLSALGGKPQPVILVGDFNSPADGSTTATYNLLTAAYTDAAEATDSGEATCCQDPDLLNVESQLTRRIDLILYRGNATAQSLTTVGNQPGDRIEGLWPSDHAGVVSTIEVRN